MKQACERYGVGCEGPGNAHHYEDLPLDIQFSDPATRFYWGEGNQLMVGDAAGLIDAYRGLGMDSAALSARAAAGCIIKQEEDGTNALRCYEDAMQRHAAPMGKKTTNSKPFFANNTALRYHVLDRFLLSGNAQKMVKCINRNNETDDPGALDLC